MFLVFGHVPDHQRHGGGDGGGSCLRDLPQMVDVDEDPWMDGLGWWAVGECPAYQDRSPRDLDIRGFFQR